MKTSKIAETLAERSTYKPIIESAAKRNILLLRLEDGSVGRKPFDIFGVMNNGKAIGIEVKVYRGSKTVQEMLKTDFSKFENLFESQQLSYLRYYGERNAVSLAFLVHQETGDIVVYNFTTKAMCSWITAERKAVTRQNTIVHEGVEFQIRDTAIRKLNYKDRVGILLASLE